MLKTTMPQRVASVVLAAALTCTLVPMDSLAVAAEAAQAAPTAENETQNPSENGATADRPSDILSATYPLDSASSSSDAAQPSGSDAEQAGEGDGPTGEAAPVAAQQAGNGNAAAHEDASAPTSEDGLEIVSANVALGAAANTVIAHNGLTYAVDEDDPDTVALVGWTGVAPTGELDVPERIATGSGTYTVANVRSHKYMGGGGSLILRLMV